MKKVILYRLSDFGYKKNKLKFATKSFCFKNIVEKFPDWQIVMFADGIKEQDTINTVDFAKNLKNCIVIENIKAGSSAASFKYVYNYALSNYTDEDIVYFVEDDYLHLENSGLIIEDLLNRAPYCTLYLHPDKFLPAKLGGNPEIGDDGGENTRLYEGSYCNFYITNSTTMTFASKIMSLKEDKDIWEKYIQGSYPQDMKIFLDLKYKGKALVCPVPTFSTHIEIPWISRFVNWKELKRTIKWSNND